MNSLQILAYLAAGLAVLLCLTFIGFAVVKLVQLQRVLKAAKRAAPTEPAALARGGMDVGKQGLTVEVDKVAEALAKLTDAFAKAPMYVVAIIAAMIFMSLAIWSAYLGRPAEPKAKPAETAPKTTTPAPTAVAPSASTSQLFERICWRAKPAFRELDHVGERHV